MSEAARPGRLKTLAACFGVCLVVAAGVVLVLMLQFFSGGGDAPAMDDPSGALEAFSSALTRASVQAALVFVLVLSAVMTPAVYAGARMALRSPRQGAVRTLGRVLAGGSLLLLLGAAVVLHPYVQIWALVTVASADFDGPQRFTPEDWAAHPEARWHMADELIDDARLAGLTRDEVYELLGPPPDTGYFREMDDVWRLGMERGLISLDSEWLAVNYDESGRVRDVIIVRD